MFESFLVWFIVWYMFWYIFGAVYFCPFTMTVYNNLHQCSWLNNFVITNIEVANIVCGVENLLTSWWLMHRWKLADIVCTVENLLTSWFSMYRGKLTALCEQSTNIWHCVYRGKLTALCELWQTYCHMCTVENMRLCSL